ncbi:unnamed protein product [Closterium sp. NIES-54]
MRQRALLPNVPACPAAQRAPLPSAPACPAAQRTSAPHCLTRQRASLPSAPARPAAQPASAPRCPARQRAPLPSAPCYPAPSAPCCPTTRALPCTRASAACCCRPRCRCPGCCCLLLPPYVLPPAAAALGAAACCCPRCCPPRCCHPRCCCHPRALPSAALSRTSAALPGVMLRCYCRLCYYRCAATATSCHYLPWPLPLSYVSGSRVCRSLSCRSSFASGLSGGAAPVEELAVGGASRVCRQKLLLPQQRREWAVRWGSPRGVAWAATTGGPCESTPAGSAAGSRGEAPGPVEAASLGAVELASAGAEPEEALHTFTLDSGASRCFFRDSTIVTPLTVPVPITLADPSEGPVVARGATVLPCPAPPSGLLIGLHLPSFAKNLVATSVLQDQWVTVTQPGGELVAIYTDSRTCQVAASVEVAASCSCRFLTHQTLLWHHCLGHPSLPRHHGMHSCLLVSRLPRSLPSLPRSLAPPCLPCVEGRQRAAPHSSSFPPTTAPLHTLHMDMRGPARVLGQGGERYFLLVVEDYTRYTTVFRWIRAVRRQLSSRFQ